MPWPPAYCPCSARAAAAAGRTSPRRASASPPPTRWSTSPARSWPPSPEHRRPAANLPRMATATVAGAAAPSRRDVATARRTRLLLGAVIFVVYLIPALIEFWHVLPHLATWEPEFGGGDLAKY